MDRDALHIRPMVPRDLDAADELLRAAFQSSASFAPELHRYRAIAPEGLFVATTRAELAGIAGAFDYGAFAYVGPMAVHPGQQQRGIGRMLLETLLTWLEARGTRLVLLDATDAGRPLYLAHGFRDAGDARLFACMPSDETPEAPRAWRDAAPSVSLDRIQAADLDAIVSFDAPLFGAARPRALRVLFDEFPERGFVTRDAHRRVTGYVCAGVRRIGPWVAQGRDEADALLAAALQMPFANAPEVAVPVGNAWAPELLERRGFRLKLTVQHMQRGSAPRPGDRGRLLAQLSFATG